MKKKETASTVENEIYYPRNMTLTILIRCWPEQRRAFGAIFSLKEGGISKQRKRSGIFRMLSANIDNIWQGQWQTQVKKNRVWFWSQIKICK